MDEQAVCLKFSFDLKYFFIQICSLSCPLVLKSTYSFEITVAFNLGGDITLDTVLYSGSIFIILSIIINQ